MRVLCWTTILLVICGCKRTGTVGTPGTPDEQVSSPLKKLMKAVYKAEAEAGGKELQAMKADVADAAKRVFSSRKIEDFSKDLENFGNNFHRVKVRDGVFVVIGHNYSWQLTPVVEQGRVREVLVGASPICRW